MVAFHKKLNIHVTAYSPLGASGFAGKRDIVKNLSLFSEPVLQTIAEKNGKSVAQVVLNWHVMHRGHIVIPKTTKPERLTENFRVFDFKLSDEEYE